MKPRPSCKARRFRELISRSRLWRGYKALCSLSKPRSPNPKTICSSPPDHIRVGDDSTSNQILSRVAGYAFVDELVSDCSLLSISDLS